MKATVRIASLILILCMFFALSAILVGAEGEDAPAAPEVWDGSADTSWYDPNSTDKTVTLMNARQLAGLSELSKTVNFYEWTIKLGADIVLNTGSAADWAQTAPANSWTPISEFWGTFDGQGYTVSGLYFNDDTAYEVGLFARLNGGTVRNVSVVNSYLCGKYQVGAIAGIIVTVYGTVENVYSDAILYAYPCSGGSIHDGAQVGGIVGANTAQYSTVSNCWFDGKAIGISDPDPEKPGDFSHDNQSSQVGGILGVGTNSSIIKDCLVTAYAEGASQVGGIVGRLIASNEHVIENCLFLGKIHLTRWTGNRTFAGEFVGIAFNGIGLTIKNCFGLDTYEATYGAENADKTDAKSAYSSNGNANLTADSTFGRLPLADLTSAAAKTKLAGFDFETVWLQEDGKTPRLTSLAYIAEHKTSGQDPKDPNEKPDDPKPPVSTTEAPTEPPTTPSEKPSDTPTDTEPTPAGATEEPKNDKGCASSLSGVAIICLPVLGVLVGVKLKKKED